VKEFTSKSAKDLYRLRILLEGTATEMAAARVSPGVIRRLEALNEGMDRYLRKDELPAFSEAHEKFHQLIFQTADNDYLQKMIEELISAASSIRYFSYSRYALPDAKRRLLAEHKKMIACLRKGERKRVGEVARDHIKAGVNHYLRNFFPHEKLIE
jgi:DNA-binding GntR family transcriptional regulator